jgi:hypothetical protein
VNCLSQKTSHRPVAVERAVISLRGKMPERPARPPRPEKADKTDTPDTPAE